MIDDLQNPNPQVSLTQQLPIAAILASLWRRRVWIAKVAVIALLLGYAGSFLIPTEYKSTTLLMPPDQQALSNVSVMNMLMTGGAASFASGAAGGLLNQKTGGSIAIGVLNSRTVQDWLIQHFNLMAEYKVKYEEDARKKLASRSAFDEDKKTGMVSITVTDHNPQRARDLADAYVQQLDRVVTTLSTSSARREREFLEQRLKGVKADLDSSSQALSKFSSKNVTFDPQKQGQATIEEADKLQAELTAAQSELSSLRTTYTDDNVRVKMTRARVASLQAQLNRTSGQSGDGTDNQALPSLRELPLLGLTYEELYRRVQMQEALYGSLTKEYELARVQEAKELPVIKVLDPAQIPDKRSWPARSLLAILVMLVAVAAVVIRDAGRIFWATRSATDPLKIFVHQVEQMAGHSENSSVVNHK